MATTNAPNITSGPTGHNRSGPRNGLPTREQVETGATKLLKRGGPTKADLHVIDLGDGPLVVKDFAHKRWWVRWLGRLQIRREYRAYRWLGEMPGLPRLIGRVDAYALAIEKIEGTELGHVADRKERGPHYFEKLSSIVRRMHAAGLVHWDLRARDNVLACEDGAVYVLDLAAAMCLRPGGVAHRWLFGWLTQPDRSALLKWKHLLDAGPLTEDERKFLRRHERLRAWWIFDPKRGKPRGKYS